MNQFFRRFSQRTANAIGRPWAFALAVLVVVGWAVLGPVFGFSDTWQLVINTGTTIVTFLSVFLIQNTQNRDADAIHLKLDELIKSTGQARNAMLDVQELEDKELDELHDEFHRLAQSAEAEQSRRRGSGDGQESSPPASARKPSQNGRAKAGAGGK